jgi:hypothetical protein
MALRIRDSLIGNRKTVLSIVLGLALLAALVFTLTGTKPAEADYNTGCGYGYNSSGTSFGYGSAYNYGYGDGHFAAGYGYSVCPLSFTPSTLPSGTVGTPYSQTFTGTGGSGSYIWSGGPVDGLTLSSSGTLSGTPSSYGTFSITVTMTDSKGVSTSSSMSLSVAAAGGGGGGGSPTTTTTAPGTTTTTTVTSPPPPAKRFFAGKIRGFAEPGKSLLLTIPGSGFYGNPKITSNERGTRVVVLHDHGTSLVIRIIVPFGSRTGEHTLTIRFANGKTLKANYSVK